MLVFRSEEHLERWLGRTGHPRGGSMSLHQLWDMVQLWYHGRLRADWRGLSANRAQEILAGVGLTGPEWSIG